jgi:hypothetical protein
MGPFDVEDALLVAVVVVVVVVLPLTHLPPEHTWLVLNNE